MFTCFYRDGVLLSRIFANWLLNKSHPGHVKEQGTWQRESASVSAVCPVQNQSVMSGNGMQTLDQAFFSAKEAVKLVFEQCSRPLLWKPPMNGWDAVFSLSLHSLSPCVPSLLFKFFFLIERDQSQKFPSAGNCLGLRFWLNLSLPDDVSELQPCWLL